MQKLKAIKIDKPETMSSTMGCRTVNGSDINFICDFEKNITNLLKNKKLDNNHYSSAQKDGRGNLAPVTIILPTLAMEAERDVEKFMVLLDKKINEAKDMLIERQLYRIGILWHNNSCRYFT